ncbi:MAG: family 43 glycosylhydrolase [Lachnospiraceae bacterium]|nr:family 43 glycosylhydrolase [Lachnospiraceae bacterium]
MPWKNFCNPLLKADFPDPDVIRVGDTYYMVSTTMHFMPGCIILRSYNLSDWEILTHVYEILEDTDKERLAGKEHAYGQGMWAASLRYHKGIFYICFVANDTGKTYLYRSENIMGPWKRNLLEGFYHDNSLLFDDDGRVYIAYGNKKIYVTELNKELTGPKPGGLHKLVVQDPGQVRLGYEGTHFYKINGKYYLFFIHWKEEENARRSQACYVSEHIAGEYRGGEVLDDDRGYLNQGVAQGGIVDTPRGEWYGILFQDSGAVGRIPVLVPVTFQKDFPVFGVEGKVPNEIKVYDARPDYKYEPIWGDDDFSYEADEAGNYHLHQRWEWNHIPDNRYWKIEREKKALCLTTDRICENVTRAINTLTQRLMYPGSEVSVTVNGEKLGVGDIAGICMLQGDYGLVGMKREKDGYYAIMLVRPAETENAMESPADLTVGKEIARMKLPGASVEIGVRTEFENGKDTAQFALKIDGEWKNFGQSMKLYFKLDHFCGCRAGLFCYSTEKTGGTAEFTKFRHRRTTLGGRNLTKLD